MVACIHRIMNSESSSVTKQEDLDPNEVKVACFLFTAVGVGYLFPFSALTQPVDYWHKIFPDDNIEFPLTTLYLWTNLLFLGLIVFLGSEPSYTLRIVGGFCGQLLVLIAVPSFYFLGLDETTHFYLVMGATAFAAIATAFVDSVAISFSAQYPEVVQEALQFGIGFSTLIGSIYRIATKLIFPPDQVVESSLLYFYTGAITILLCIFAYFHLINLPISHQCLTYGQHFEEDEELRGEKSLHEIADAMRQAEGGLLQMATRQSGLASGSANTVGGSAYAKLPGHARTPTSTTSSPAASSQHSLTSSIGSPYSTNSRGKGLTVVAHPRHTPEAKRKTHKRSSSNSSTTSSIGSGRGDDNGRSLSDGIASSTASKRLLTELKDFDYGAIEAAREEGRDEREERERQRKRAEEDKSDSAAADDDDGNKSIVSFSATVDDVPELTDHFEAIDKWALLYKVRFNEFIVFLLFFSTLLLWPPLITEIKSFNFPHLQQTQWWSLLLLAVFSLSDCIGRVCVPYRGWLTKDNIWIAVLLRFLLFPLIICSVKGLYFTNDLFSTVFVFALGFTNGYLGTLSIVMVNERVEENEKGVVGTFTGFFLNAGLVFGASAGLTFKTLVLG